MSSKVKRYVDYVNKMPDYMWKCDICGRWDHINKGFFCFSIFPFSLAACQYYIIKTSSKLPGSHCFFYLNTGVIGFFKSILKLSYASNKSIRYENTLSWQRIGGQMSWPCTVYPGCESFREAKNYFFMLCLTASISHVYTNAYPFHKASCSTAHALNMKHSKGRTGEYQKLYHRKSDWPWSWLQEHDTLFIINVSREYFACSADVTRVLCIYWGGNYWKESITMLKQFQQGPEERQDFYVIKVNIVCFWGKRSE